VVCDKIPVTDEDKYRPIDGEEQFPAAAIFHFNEDHRWWFFSEMNRDEVLLLKFHDSLESVARRVPHTAFHNPLAQATQARRSIELRSVAYFF